MGNKSDKIDAYRETKVAK